jgi:hypothetical protein
VMVVQKEKDCTRKRAVGGRSRDVSVVSISKRVDELQV